MQIAIQAETVNDTLARGLGKRLTREHNDGMIRRAGPTGTIAIPASGGSKGWLKTIQRNVRRVGGEGLCSADIVGKRYLVVHVLEHGDGQGEFNLRQVLYDARKRNNCHRIVATITRHAVQRFIERRAARDGAVSLGELRAAIADPLMTIIINELEGDLSGLRERDYQVATEAGVIVCTPEPKRIIVKTFIARETLGRDRAQACERAGRTGNIVVITEEEEIEFEEEG